MGSMLNSTARLLTSAWGQKRLATLRVWCEQLRLTLVLICRLRDRPSRRLGRVGMGCADVAWER